MTSTKIPTHMKAWQYTETQAGLENTLKLSTTVKVPTPPSDHHLVRITNITLNPLDYKPAEIPFLHRFIVPRPGIPGTDFCGRIVKPAAGSALKEGQLIFGVSSKQIFAGGALAEYAAVPTSSTSVVPEGLSPAGAACIPIAGLTGYQSIVPYIKSGDRVFINGGSGGTGVFAIQIAKEAGAHVTVTCSTANVELCKSLGADEVIDYREGPVLNALKRLAKDTAPFDHAVDNVCNDMTLFWKADQYLKPNGRFVLVAASPGPAFVAFMLRATLVPGFLGGAKRKLVRFVADCNRPKELDQIARWMIEGKVRQVVDQTFAFEDAKEAMRRMKSGRARGKIVVEVVAAR